MCSGAVGEGAEEDLLDDGEHGGVDADAEPQGDDGGKREGWGLPELPEGEAKVLGQRGHAGGSPLLEFSNCSAADGMGRPEGSGEFCWDWGRDGGWDCPDVEGGVRKWAGLAFIVYIAARVRQEESQVGFAR